MKKFIAAFALVAATVGGASTASAQVPAITLGLPAVAGTGCPAGSVDAILSPDKTTLSILFSSYVAEAGGTTGLTFDRKSCNVAIPVNVPNGISVSIIGVDYRGFNQLPAGASSQFNVEYFFAGGRGPVFRQDFRGPIATDYLIHNDIVATAMVWSACGQPVTLRTNTNIRVNTTGGQQAMATVDTQDVQAAVIYNLQFRRC
jgi:hypothetical protein